MWYGIKKNAKNTPAWPFDFWIIAFRFILSFILNQNNHGLSTISISFCHNISLSVSVSLSLPLSIPFSTVIPFPHSLLRVCQQNTKKKHYRLLKKKERKSYHKFCLYFPHFVFSIVSCVAIVCFRQSPSDFLRVTAPPSSVLSFRAFGLGKRGAEGWHSGAKKRPIAHNINLFKQSLCSNSTPYFGVQSYFEMLACCCSYSE